jgi:type IV secretion system protein VirB2
VVCQRGHIKNIIPRRAVLANVFLSATLTPTLAFAQAASPFSTGANSLVSFALTIATPIAVLIVIALAIAAAVGKISWGWVIAAIIGIACIFGAQQIVTWIRSLFGV